jgi:hypothetical protein
MIGILLVRPETYYLIAWTVLLVAATAMGKKRTPTDHAPPWRREFSWKWLAPTSNELRRFGAVADRRGWPERELLDSCSAAYASLLEGGMRKISR